MAFDLPGTDRMGLSWRVFLENESDVIVGVTGAEAVAMDAVTHEPVATNTMTTSLLIQELVGDRLVQPGNQRVFAQSLFMPRRSLLELRVNVTYRSETGADYTGTVTVPVRRPGE
jgi:hypothetical protein